MRFACPKRELAITEWCKFGGDPFRSEVRITQNATVKWKGEEKGEDGSGLGWRIWER